MAARLTMVFGGSAESRMVQQAQFDLAHVLADRFNLERLDLVQPTTMCGNCADGCIFFCQPISIGLRAFLDCG